jgi:hypothetical protein
MNMNTNNTKTATKRAGLAAALLAAAVMLGGLAIRDAAIASARELDVVAFEECVQKADKDGRWSHDQNVYTCCVDHGGDPFKNPDGSYNCGAPSRSPSGSIDPQPQDPRSGTYKPPQGPVATAP